ncbi:hypothetical protein HIM_10178 [Hirsutella minnesotensis 3608]|uniref:BED-type domain-containing protein n=1 Tax=Hirsutella minnesotensis 3608 TaxID=1043627 RepID=A0A0F7ZKC9_9HYPO|nr:hypothetical protein HIM_10178 [Hirsutella minnesotensis 3608]
MVAVSTPRPFGNFAEERKGKIDFTAAWTDATGTKWWHCQPCWNKKKAKKYNYSGGSSTIVNHLRKEHRIILPGRQENRRQVTQSRLGDINRIFGDEAQVFKKRKTAAAENALDQSTFRKLYCRYVVACSLPFSHVEQPAFRDLVQYICPAANDLLPTSGSTIRNDLQRGYNDNWTSPNHLGVIGFTVQFVTEDHGLLSLVVRIKELQGHRSGENMAEAIMEFVREYGIASKVGCFMMDNASNMNTMIDKVSDGLESEFDVFYDPPQHQLRCFSHTITLAVMEFLIGERPHD